MQISHRNGIVFSANGQLFVDASGLRGKEALITHAHSDHARATSSNTYYMTPQTAALLGPPGKRRPNFRETPFGRKFFVGDFECCFRPSGHILGSAQLQASNGVEAVLTSDFKLQKSILFDGAEVLPGEILVIESTFGVPEYSFPEREEVYADIKAWVSRNTAAGKLSVLGGYSTGKAQELTKIVNEFAGQTPVVYRKIFEQNRAYEGQGVKLGDYELLNGNIRDFNVLILPPHLIDDHLLSALGHQLGRKAEAAIATGWSGHSKYESFPLSDHADFEGLLQYVRESSPKQVFTTHGFEEEFASAVRKRLGIPARPLSRKGQATLGDFPS